MNDEQMLEYFEELKASAELVIALVKNGLIKHEPHTPDFDTSLYDFRVGKFYIKRRTN